MQQPSSIEPSTAYSPDTLENDYYSPLTTKCSDAINCIISLHNGDMHQATTPFTSLSKKLTDQLGSYIYHARYSLMPYIIELTKKEETGHDCRSCSGSCKVNHGKQLVFLQLAHAEIIQTLDQLYLISITEERKHLNGTSVMLHDLVTSIDAMVRQLFLVDDIILIPTIKAAQNHIHAHH